MKRLTVVYEMDSCGDCPHSQFLDRYLWHGCLLVPDHPSLRHIPDRYIDGEGFPEWCPIPDVPEVTP